MVTVCHGVEVSRWCGNVSREEVSRWCGSVSGGRGE